MQLDLPQLTGEEKLPELIDAVAKLQKMVQFLMNGKISSKNIREIGGYNVDDTELMSDDGDVGLSSAYDTADPVRLWAGSPIKEIAPWRVTRFGKMSATGATIQSQSGYPKLEIDPNSHLLAAYKDAQHWLKINPNDSSSGVPSLQWFDQTTGRTAFLYFDGSIPILLIQAVFADIQITAGGDLRLEGSSVLIKGVDVLNTKADKSAVSKTVYVSATSGGPATTPMTITNGVVTS